MKILIRPRPTPIPTSEAVIALTPLSVKVMHRPLKILDFDVECRPLHWIAQDYVSQEITAIAWAWTDQPDQIACHLLGEESISALLAHFVAAYNQADLVTGHFIRGYDLPVINGALSEYKLPPLDDKMTQDTKLDLIKRRGLSGSQENLGAMLNLMTPKVKMHQSAWREANRLTPAGLEATRQRVVGDVRQHLELYAKLLELHYLRPPVLWKSGSGRLPDYTA